MPSMTEICNLALGNIRAGSINDIDEPSLQAQTCKLRFNIVLEKILRENNWQFARKIIALAPVTDVIFNYAYAYRYPADCLKIERLILPWEQITADDGAARSRFYDNDLPAYRPIAIPYDVFNVDNVKLLGANEADLRIDYTAKITDTNLFTADFSLALSHLLASEIAIPIVGAADGRKLRADSLELYGSYLKSAAAIDCSEKYHSQPESEFISVRR